MPDTQSHSTNPLPDPRNPDATRSFHSSNPPATGDDDFRLTQDPPTKSIIGGSLSVEAVGEGLHKIGRFEIRSKLGEGAFGVVYRGYDPLLDRDVAIKIAKPGVLASPRKVQRFLREAKATANLRHPNIVPLFETGVENNQHFIVTSYLEGQPLNQIIRTEGQFDIDRATRLIQKIAEGVAYAHSQGIIHRDIKPHNIMLDSKDEPVLLDFGLAQRADAGDEKLTQDGSIMGTPAYMSPEQAAGEGTAYSDQYSIGVTLYELLTGRTPFEGGVNQQLLSHQMDTVISPRKLRLEIPRDLENICLKCLEKEPSRRYSNCDDLASDLQKFQAGEIVSARQPSLVEKTLRAAKKNPGVFSLTGLVLLVFAIGLGTTLWQLDRANFNANEAKKAAKTAEDEKKTAEQREADAQKAEQTAEEKSKQYLEEKTKAENLAKRANNGEHTLQMELASRAWDRGDILEAERQLAKIQPEFQTTWETRFLNSLIASVVKSYRINSKSIMVSALVPSKNKFYTVDDFGEVIELDLLTGEQKKLFKLVGLCVRLCVSPDLKYLVASYHFGELEFWDMATKKSVKKIKAHKGKSIGLIFTSDSSTLYSLGHDSLLKIFKSNGDEIFSNSIEMNMPSCLSLSPNGAYLAISANTTSVAIIWDIKAKKTKCSLKTNAGNIHGNCFSPDSKNLYTCGFDYMLRIWDIEKMIEIKSHRLQGLRPLHISINKSGTQIITASVTDYSRSEICVTDVTTGNLLGSYWAHANEILELASFEEGDRFLTVDRFAVVRAWNRTSRERTIPGDIGPLATRFASEDAEKIVGRTPEKTVLVRSAKKDSPPQLLSGDKDVWTVAMTDDGKRAVTLSIKSQGIPFQLLSIYKTDEVQPIKQFHLQNERPTSLALTNDGKKTLQGTGNWNLYVWDNDTGKMLHSLRHFASIHAISCSLDNKLVYLAGGKEITAHDLETGKRINTFENVSPTSNDMGLSLALHPDGTKLYVGFQSGIIVCIDPKTGKQLGTFTGHTISVHSLCLSRDGKRLFSGSGDKTVRVWDTEYFIEKMAIKGHPSGLVGLNLVDNDTRLLAATHDYANADGKVYLWDIIPEGLPKK